MLKKSNSSEILVNISMKTEEQQPVKNARILTTYKRCYRKILVVYVSFQTQSADETRTIKYYDRTVKYEVINDSYLLQSIIQLYMGVCL